MSDTPPDPHGRTAAPGALAALVAMAAASAAFAWWYVGDGFWCDDAFISFRYARNLVTGLGLVYNPGEVVEGFSNFLWMMLASVAIRLGVEPIDALQVLGIACQATTLWWVYLLGDPRSRGPYRALVAPAFLTLHIAFLSYPMTGMETSCFTMLVTLAVWLYQREGRESWAGSGALAMTFVALSLVRFDGFVLVGILVAYQMFVARERKTTVRAMVPYLIVMVAYHAWRIGYYPTILPNTVHAKVGFSISELREGLEYLYRFLQQGGAIPVALACLPFLLGRAREGLLLLAWTVTAQVAYTAVVGGDWMPFHRLMFHVLPLLLVLAQEGLWSLVEATQPLHHRSRTSRVAGALLLVYAAGLIAAPLVQERDLDQLRSDYFRPEDARRIALHLDRTLPPNYTLLSEWGGILPYHLRQPVLDPYGLTDRAIASADFQVSRAGRIVGLEYLAGRGAELAVPNGRIRPTYAMALATLEPGNEGYVYKYMGLKKLGYSPCVIRIDDDAYWAALLRSDLPRESLCVAEPAGAS